MKLTDYYYMGGSGFMFVITVCGILMLIFTAKILINYFVQKVYSKQGLGLILLFGSLSAVIGFFGQAIGLFMAFSAIEVASDISPAIVVGGLKASMIAPLWGTMIFMLSLIIWGLLREVHIRMKPE